jgi:hypothetical protein
LLKSRPQRSETAQGCKAFLRIIVMPLQIPFRETLEQVALIRVN